MDIVKGYQIQKEAVFEHGQGFALGYNPSAQSPFVIWHFSVMADGKRNFYDCTSCRGILPPEKEFEKFLSAYDYVYKVPRLNEGQETPAAEYYRYYTRYPLDDNTFPKAKELGLLEIAPYDKRIMVENETIQAWGEVIYTKPLTEKQLAYYDLPPAPNNPDMINQRGEQAAERRQKPSISARLTEGTKQAAGFEVKRRRGGDISFLVPGQERFTQLRASTLGEGYGPEDILAVIEGRAAPVKSRTGATRKVNLIVDIQAKMRAGKGPAYEKWATIYNLKQMAAALQYLQENGLMEYEQLEKKAAEATERFHSLSDSIKATEAAMSVNAELKAAIVSYAKTRPVFEGYKAARCSKKYLAEHEADIAAYRAAGTTMNRLLNGGKLPKMDALKAEYQKLAADKKTAYREYRAAKKEMQEVIAAKANIDHLLGLTDAQKNKEIER